MKLLPLLPASAVLCLAQVCAPSPETKNEIDSVRNMTSAGRLEAARALRDKYPDNFWVQRAYIDALPDRETRIREYQQALAEHPDDPKYLYYRGSTLIGAHTPDAIKFLDQALEKDPELASAHARLAVVYASANFKDHAKLKLHLSAYLKACPDADLSIYSYLERIDAPELVRPSAAALRKTLSAREKPSDLYFYRTLWAIEFKAYSPAEHEQVRERIRKDLQRLRDAGVKEHPQLAATMREGYKLAGDKDGLKWLDEQVPGPETSSPSMAVFEAFRKFNEQHPYPKQDGTAASRRAANDERNQALLAASADWIQKWPDEESAWMQRQTALNLADHSGPPGPDPAFEQVGSNLLRLANKSHDPANLKITVAGMYLAHKMHLDELEAMLNDGLADLDKRKIDPPNDLSPPMPTANSRLSMLRTKVRGLNTLCDVYSNAAKWDRLEQTLPKLRDTLNDQKSTGFAQPFEEQTWKDNYARYWEKMARAAENRGHKMDALIYYQHVRDPDLRSNFAGKFLAENAARKAKELWTSLGGTDQGWAEWSLPSGTQKTAAANPDLAAFDNTPEANKKLPEFAITDVAGKSWKLADLKGKVTLINLWATWCAPCREELPLLQKLFDRVKDRPEIRVLTLNTDDNSGLIEPFLKENHYTFPVLPARDYVDTIVPALSIPRNWIVDKNGVLKSAASGFNPFEGDAWIERMLKSLDKMIAE